LDFEQYKKACKRGGLKKHTVLVTFDDGYKDNFIHAYPILKELKIPALISVSTGFIGKTRAPWWDVLNYALHNTKKKMLKITDLGEISLDNKESAMFNVLSKLKQMPEDKKNRVMDQIVKSADVSVPKSHAFLTWPEIKKMNDYVSIGAHTVNHSILTKVSLDAAKKEIDESKKQIEKKIGKPVRVFTYPNGQPEDMSKEIDEHLKASGHPI